MTNLLNATKLVYAETTLDIPAGTALDALKASLSEVFPETATADFVVEGDTVHVRPRAGTKGSEDITVVYSDTTLTVPAGTSADSIRSSMTEIFPELSNAEMIQEGNTVRFVAKAGTKGSGEMTFVYADTTLQIPAGTSIEALRASVQEIFPELGNATFSQEGNVITAAVRAGTKGINA